MFNLFYYSMKNIKLFSLLFVAAAMIFAGCTKEIESVEPGGGEGEGTEEGLVYKEFTVGASEVGGSKSRTVLGDRGSVLWQANDKIRVFADVDGANAEGYEFTTKEGGESATFAGMVAQADNYYALYPYDAYNTKGGIIKGSNDSIFICANIPDVQRVPVAGGYDPKACISVAQINMSGNSTFRLACGMIGFKFVNQTTLDIKEIQVIFNDYSIIRSSYMKICVNKEDVVNSFAMIPQQNRVIRIMPEEVDKSFANSTVYYACLPPFKDTQVITVKFINSEGTAFVKTVSGKILRAFMDSNKNDLILTAENYNKNISTPEEFKQWYNNDINTYGKVTLTADINMKGIELTSKAFSGIFDGGGHTISNLTMKPINLGADAVGNNGLFSSIEGGGQVTNLILEEPIINGGNLVGTICGSIMGNSSNLVYISGCKIIHSVISGSVVGGIVGKCDYGMVDGCSVTDVELKTSYAGGGLVGSFNSGCIFRASYVTGEIDKLYPITTSRGGIMGLWNDAASLVISCYSFTDLKGGEGYIYGGPTTETSRVMHSSFYVSDSVQEDIKAGVINVSRLKSECGTLNDYLEDANSGYRYVVNPNYSEEDFSTPPLILEKAQ